MPKIKYQDINIGADRLAIVDMANTILDEYEKQGYDLTLRQLYYQFVRRDWFPKSWADPATKSTNNERSYKRLGDIINDARLAGLIDWDRIIDRTRNLRSLAHWDSPQDIINSVSTQFRILMWDRQPTYVETWIEKDALVGVIEGECQKYDVPFFSCRGYTSQSEMWSAAMRIVDKLNDGKRVLILHLGDHDPSGIDMSRDIEDRVRMFAAKHLGDSDGFDIKRLALNMDQVKKYDPPPNPAKVTDSRAKEYIRKHGDSSWELDALEPNVITTLIGDSLAEVIDWDLWKEDQARIDTGRKELKLVATKWERAVAAAKKSA